MKLRVIQIGDYQMIRVSVLCCITFLTAFLNILPKEAKASDIVSFIDGNGSKWTLQTDQNFDPFYEDSYLYPNSNISSIYFSQNDIETYADKHVQLLALEAISRLFEISNFSVGTVPSEMFLSDERYWVMDCLQSMSVGCKAGKTDFDFDERQIIYEELLYNAMTSEDIPSLLGTEYVTLQDGTQLFSSSLSNFAVDGLSAIQNAGAVGSKGKDLLESAIQLLSLNPDMELPNDAKAVGQLAKLMKLTGEISEATFNAYQYILIREYLATTEEIGARIEVLKKIEAHAKSLNINDSAFSQAVENVIETLEDEDVDFAEELASNLLTLTVDNFTDKVKGLLADKAVVLAVLRKTEKILHVSNKMSLAAGKTIASGLASGVSFALEGHRTYSMTTDNWRRIFISYSMNRIFNSYYQSDQDFGSSYLVDNGGNVTYASLINSYRRSFHDLSASIAKAYYDSILVLVDDDWAGYVFQLIDSSVAMLSSPQLYALHFAPAAIKYGTESGKLLVRLGQGDDIEEAKTDVENIIDRVSKRGVALNNWDTLFINYDLSNKPAEEIDKPIARIELDATNVIINTEVSLNGALSEGSGGNSIASYSWTLNSPSGSNSNIQNSNSEQASFVPDVTGPYVVTLVVATSESNSDSASEIIYASSPSVTGHNIGLSSYGGIPDTVKGNNEYCIDIGAWNKGDYQEDIKAKLTVSGPSVNYVSDEKTLGTLNSSESKSFANAICYTLPSSIADGYYTFSTTLYADSGDEDWSDNTGVQTGRAGEATETFAKAYHYNEVTDWAPVQADLGLKSKCDDVISDTGSGWYGYTVDGKSYSIAFDDYGIPCIKFGSIYESKSGYDEDEVYSFDDGNLIIAVDTNEDDYLKYFIGSPTTFTNHNPWEIELGKTKQHTFNLPGKGTGEDGPWEFNFSSNKKKFDMAESYNGVDIDFDRESHGFDIDFTPQQEGTHEIVFLLEYDHPDEGCDGEFCVNYGYFFSNSIYVYAPSIDSDNDGIIDDSDAFPLDPAASIDSDGDGFPDGWNPGKTEDDSTTGLKLDLDRTDPLVNADSDGDGVADYYDLFPNNFHEAYDADKDGVGDNSDAFPFDIAASIDTDGDGAPDSWNLGKSQNDSAMGLHLDAFPTDPAASIDSDKDGFPDAWNVGKSEIDSTTLLTLDMFPSDDSEWSDADFDGVGDNSDWAPNDQTEWQDTDEDGVGDNSDVAPDDPDRSNNSAPDIEKIQDLELNTGDFAIISLNIQDSEGDSYVVNIVNGPSFIEVVGDSIEVSPGVTDAGYHVIQIKVVDAYGAQITSQFKLLVNDLSGKANQTISFSGYPDTLKVGASSFLLATATSELNVNFSSQTPSVCSIIMQSVKAINQGTCIVAANQAGNDFYHPALEVSKNIVVNELTMALDSGDINADGEVNLSDLLTSLRLAIGEVFIGSVHLDADVNGDLKIGVEESIFILRDIAGFNPADDIYFLIENFESGLNEWVQYGSPAPIVVESIYGHSKVFDNNGDASYASGAYSKNSVDISNGGSVEADIYVDFNNLSGCWATATLELTRESEPVTSSTQSPANAIMWAMGSYGDACWATDAQYRQHSWFTFRVLTEDGTWDAVPNYTISADAYVSGWHKAKMNVLPDKRVEFLIDDTLLWTSTEPVADEYLQGKKIALGSRSSGSAGKVYHDNIKVTPSSVDYIEGFEASDINQPPLGWAYQSSWGDTGQIRVVDTPVSAGNRSLRVQGQAGWCQGVYRSGTTGDGDKLVTFDLYIPSGGVANTNPGSLFYNGIRVTPRYQGGNSFQLYLDGELETVIPDLATDTWHQIELEMDSDTTTSTLRVIGGSQIGPHVYTSNLNGGWASDVSLYGNNNSSGYNTIYVDNLSIENESIENSDLLYNEDFQDDPAFTSLSTDHAYWDSAEGNYYVNTRDNLVAKYWAYSPQFDSVDLASGGSIELDILFVVQDWGTYPGVFFYLNEPLELNAEGNEWVLRIENFYADNHYKRLLIQDSVNPYLETPTIKDNTWYHVSIASNGDDTANIHVTERDAGNLIYEIYNTPFEVDAFQYLGVGYYGNPDYGDSWSPVRVDNIEIRQ